MNKISWLIDYFLVSGPSDSSRKKFVWISFQIFLVVISTLLNMAVFNALSQIKSLEFLSGLSSLTAAVLIALLTWVHEMGHRQWMLMVKVSAFGPLIVGPLFGLMLSKEEPETTYQKSLVVLGGPLTGLIIAPFLYLLGANTGFEIFIICGILWAMVNFLNLFPVYPLDGGFIAFSILSTVTTKANKVGWILTLLAVAFLLALINDAAVTLLILVTVLVAGLVDQILMRVLINEPKRKQEKVKSKMTNRETVFVTFSYTVYLVGLFALLVSGVYYFL